MRIEAHCFAYGVKISPLPINFRFKDWDATIAYSKHDDDEGLILKVSKPISESEVSPIPVEQRDERGEFIEKRMRPYKEALTEVSQLVEGFLSIMYFGVPPKFDTDRVVVNVIAENNEEQRKKDSGEINGGFGSVFQPPQKFAYEWGDKIIPAIEEASKHLPAFSFLAQAIRSQASNEQEVAFFLYFRVLEGYLSDGASDLEKTFLQQTDTLKIYIREEDKLKEATRNILTTLRLQSKSITNYEGLISDIVLIRHKLTHFSASHAERHHRASIKFDLNTVNFFMRRACTLLLRDKINI